MSQPLQNFFFIFSLCFFFFCSQNHPLLFTCFVLASLVTRTFFQDKNKKKRPPAPNSLRETQRPTSLELFFVCIFMA